MYKKSPTAFDQQIHYLSAGLTKIKQSADQDDVRSRKVISRAKQEAFSEKLSIYLGVLSFVFTLRTDGSIFFVSFSKSYLQLRMQGENLRS